MFGIFDGEPQFVGIGGNVGPEELESLERRVGADAGLLPAEGIEPGDVYAAAVGVSPVSVFGDLPDYDIKVVVFVFKRTDAGIIHEKLLYKSLSKIPGDNCTYVLCGPYARSAAA
jgi:hypothetical protein